MNDRRIKIDDIASEFKIPHGSVSTIIHEHIGMSKVSASWFPRDLNIQDRFQRLQSSRELLGVYEENPESFHARLVTSDKTWIHHLDPGTKQESMQWKHPSSLPPKKIKTQPSAGKVMATVFWESKCVLIVEYKPAGLYITGAYYADLMKQLRPTIKEKRRGKLSQCVLLIYGNAPVHKSRIAQAAIPECKLEQLNHPSYSPNLAPSDYYLCRNLKSHLRRTRYLDDDELNAATDAWFEEQTGDFYFKGIDSLKVKWA